MQLCTETSSHCWGKSTGVYAVEKNVLITWKVVEQMNWFIMKCNVLITFQSPE